MDAMSVLVVDDDPVNLDLIAQQLAGLGAAILTAQDGKAALGQLRPDFPGIVVTDLKMPRMDGLELLRHGREADPDLPLIIVTGHGDIAIAVQAIRDGAYDFIERPYDADRLREMVARALNARALVLENRALRAELKAKAGLEARLLGSSPVMEDLRRSIARVAETDANVLIIGETGTGKELVARSLHDLGNRSRQRFVPVNCGALPESLFESELFGHESGAFTGAAKRRIGRLEYAHQGTLFLDEIDSLPLSMQAKLLRVLQERQIERLGSNESIKSDFRTIAATQTDLKKAIETGAFRSDLFYRLDVAEIHLPALRERREDIPLLFQAFADELSAHHKRESPRLGREDIQALMTYSWPGNVRELRNVVERYVLGLHHTAGALARALPALDGKAPGLHEQLDAFERCVLEQELSMRNGNIQAAADALGLPVRTLNDRMRRHGLIRKDYLS
ncbi:MAG: sigma-54-dependent Fis family transcriptional regulator [Rhodospirillaceae bacterium]|nr:sigma-54-dependent Fis family transcriptional regulator [Rhodospirillaceae bacterium]